MIVKLQKSITSTDAKPPVLVYDQHRTFNTMLEMTPELEKLFGPKLKIYCKAEIDDKEYR